MHMRSEQTIFNDLAILCSSPGYVHTIAYLCFRDNMIPYSGEMTSEDMQHLFSTTRLIRTETSTLIGLLLKCDIDYKQPSPDVMLGYISRTDSLLEEMHLSMSEPFFTSMTPGKIIDKHFPPFSIGAVLREPIFYGGESAYLFQYRDMAPIKYANDNDWLRTNKGFSIQDARAVVFSIGQLHNDKTVSTLLKTESLTPEQRTLLPGYTFTTDEVAHHSHLDPSIVKMVLTAFTIPTGEKNQCFNSLHDFNIANAFPLIWTSDDTFILFHIYSLAESLYESPFYWMLADKSYVNTAMKHRGVFTEEFSAVRLAHVFGKGNVHSNIDILAHNGEKAGEIDVLVLYGNRAIVLQAKSKRLTIESRKGNDLQIREDFKKSVQDSYDQAYKCAKMLGDANYTLKDCNLNEITVTSALKDVYIMCVVSDHYPALSFQARQFLCSQTTNEIPPPYILDVFTLDAMTEMLDSPLKLLSYVDRRVKYSDKLMATHETTILAYHLKLNLWLSKEQDLVVLGDDLAADLDLAMIVRRDGVPGKSVPEGILTRIASTTLGHFVRDIEAKPDPATIDLGYMLLTLSESTVIEVSKGIEELVRRSRIDGKNHDLTVDLGSSGTGLTIHCNSDPIEVAERTLRGHCFARKYTQHAQTWFGVCVSPCDTLLRFGLNLDYKWEHNDKMDILTRHMPKPGKGTVEGS